jgi:hypothetical protein
LAGPAHQRKGKEKRGLREEKAGRLKWAFGPEKGGRKNGEVFFFFLLFSF